MRKIINLIPSFFTLLNIFFGFIAIIYAFSQEFKMAGLAIFYGTLCDLLDGRLARKLKTSNEIGKEMDSFADFLTFGVAPAFLAYNMTTQNFIDPVMNMVCSFIAFFYTLCTAIRLTIFNIGTYYKKVKKRKNSNFIGMPSTFAGLTIASLAAYDAFYHGFLYESIINFDQMPYFILGITLFLSIAMLLPVQYPRFFDIYFNYKNKNSAIFSTIALILLFLFSRIIYLICVLATIFLPILISILRTFKIIKN